MVLGVAGTFTNVETPGIGAPINPCRAVKRSNVAVDLSHAWATVGEFERKKWAIFDIGWTQRFVSTCSRTSEPGLTTGHPPPCIRYTWTNNLVQRAQKDKPCCLALRRTVDLPHAEREGALC